MGKFWSYFGTNVVDVTKEERDINEKSALTEYERDL